MPNTDEIPRRTPWCIAHIAFLAGIHQFPNDEASVLWQASWSRVGSAFVERSTFEGLCEISIAMRCAPMGGQPRKIGGLSTAALSPPCRCPSGLAAAEDRQMAMAVEVFNRLFSVAVWWEQDGRSICRFPFRRMDAFRH